MSANYKYTQSVKSSPHFGTFSSQPVKMPLDRCSPRPYPLESAPPYLRSYPSSTASTRSLLKDYSPAERCLNSKCGCRLAILALVVLLVIWGITVPLYFFVGPGRSDIQKAAEVHLMEQLSGVHNTASAHSAKPGTAKYNNGTIFSAVNCSIRIANQPFSPELQDPDSLHFKTLALQLETLLTVVFQEDHSFQRAVVRTIRPDTLVEIIILFTEERADIQEYVIAVLTEYLMTHRLMLGRFQMDLTTLAVSYITDPCRILNGGCSHVCYWSVLRSQRLCECPDTFILNSDNATCIQRIVAKVSSLGQGGCDKGQFACGQNDICIPQSWLCDGVSDCIQEEDEQPWICDLNTPGLRELSREILPLEVLVNDVDRSAIRNMLRINIGQRSPEESNSPNLDTEDSIGGDKELSIINYNIDKVSNS